MTDEIKFDEDGYGPTIYKLDSKNNTRFWRMQLSGCEYRTHSGIDGKDGTHTKWTTVESAKSQSSPAAQAEFEVRAQYAKKLKREYHRSLDNVEKPKIVQPMLAKTYGKVAFSAGHAQPKLDGMRCIATKEGLFSRTGQPINAVPHLHAGLKALFDEHPGAILDGELYNHDYRNDFNTLMSVCRKQNPTAEELARAEKVVQYHIYDTIMDEPFEVRLAQLLEWHAQDLLGWCPIVPTTAVFTEEMFDTAYGEYVAAGYEGGMLRPKGDTGYQLKTRSKFLLKRKDFETDEFEVVRVEPGQGNWAGAAKRFVLRTADKREFGAGVRGSYEEMQKVLEGPTPKEVTLRFFGLTPDGIPRFPVVIDIHKTGRKD